MLLNSRFTYFNGRLHLRLADNRNQRIVIDNVRRSRKSVCTPFYRKRLRSKLIDFSTSSAGPSISTAAGSRELSVTSYPSAGIPLRDSVTGTCLRILVVSLNVKIAGSVLISILPSGVTVPSNRVSIGIRYVPSVLKSDISMDAVISFSPIEPIPMASPKA